MPTLRQTLAADLPPAEPDDEEPESEEPKEPSELEYEDVPCTDDGDDPRWDAFIPDDDECDPEPDQGDFWFETSQSDKERGRQGDKETSITSPSQILSLSPSLLVSLSDMEVARCSH